MKWLDKIPFPMLIMASVFLGLAPFPMKPEPHLFEKLTMLFDGSLGKPVDIFDLLMHGTPAVLLCLKAMRHFTNTEK